MQFDLTLFTTAFVTLLVIMDPLGNVPVFLALTKGVVSADSDRAIGPARRRIALHAVAAATVIVYLFAFFGGQILSALSISLPALQAAGGVMLFLVALQMVSGTILDLSSDAGGEVNVAIVPLGTPLVAGPGTIAAAMVFMAGGTTAGPVLERQLSVGLAIAAALTVVYLVLRYSLLAERVLKDNGIHLVTRVMGMLLLAISVEMVAGAVMKFVATGGAFAG